jgi:hypothetical protein
VQSSPAFTQEITESFGILVTPEIILSALGTVIIRSQGPCPFKDMKYIAAPVTTEFPYCSQGVFTVLSIVF